MQQSLRNWALALGVAVAFASASSASELTDSLKKGNPELKSATALAFGPEGILFVGDPTAATIYAIGTGDTANASKDAPKQEKIVEKIAALLGITSAETVINDFKVNPASGNLYFSVSRGKGTGSMPAIVKLERGGKLSVLEVKGVPFSSVKLPNASDKSRTEAITGLAYVKGQLIIAGLSNEEFASKLRAVPFPFKEVDRGACVEIFHGAHGKLETHSPVRTFTVYDIAGKSNLLAAYTCTPLVRIPLDDLKPGEKVKGTTIAELGNRNRPLDMIVYTKDDKDYLLLANNARGVMKIKLDGVEKAEPITKPAQAKSGLPYDTVADLQDVVQLDKLDDGHAVILTGKGVLDTVTLP